MRFSSLRTPAAVLVLAAISTWGFARTWTVDDDGPADFAAIQAAIGAAQAGDVIEVRPGIYAENLVLKCGVVVRGAGPDLVTVDGRQSGPVASITGCDGTTVLEGLRIFNGRAEYGGGVLVQGGAPIIRRNSIVGNRALDPTGVVYGYGGGLALLNTGALASGNLIENNDADYGGGIEVGGGTPRILGNEIRGNTAALSGGGVDASLTPGRSVLIHGNRILSNSSAYGGGIEIFGFGSAIVTSNLISGNAATDPVVGFGGGVDVLYGDVRLVNNTLVGNQADIGGGIALLSDTASQVVNNIIAGNRAQESAGIDLVSPQAQVLSNILDANQGGDCGGLDAILCDEASNLFLDPQFISVPQQDFRLSPASPAIDSGAAQTIAAPDLRGQRRPLDGDGDRVARFDRGACEFDHDAVLELMFTDPLSLTWRPQEGAASYHVYSGPVSSLRSGGPDLCRDDDDADRGDLRFIETLVPPVGDGLVYNVTAVVGGVERSAGFDSGGLERTILFPCP